MISGHLLLIKKVINDDDFYDVIIYISRSSEASFFLINKYSPLFNPFCCVVVMVLSLVVSIGVFQENWDDGV